MNALEKNIGIQEEFCQLILLSFVDEEGGQLLGPTFNFYITNENHVWKFWPFSSIPMLYLPHDQTLATFQFKLKNNMK